jgi:amino acid transporter
MKHTVLLFLACILAGFALNSLPPVAFLTGLVPFFKIVGALAIIIFSFALLYYGIKALLGKS